MGATKSICNRNAAAQFRKHFCYKHHYVQRIMRAATLLLAFNVNAIVNIEDMRPVGSDKPWMLNSAPLVHRVQRYEKIRSRFDYVLPSQIVSDVTVGRMLIRAQW